MVQQPLAADHGVMGIGSIYKSVHLFGCSDRVNRSNQRPVTLTAGYTSQKRDHPLPQHANPGAPTDPG